MASSRLRSAGTTAFRNSEKVSNASSSYSWILASHLSLHLLQIYGLGRSFIHFLLSCFFFFSYTHPHIHIHSHSHVDIRKLYFKAAVDNKPTVFLFTDTQVVEESFLEDINNILSSGEVPNLYKPDEFEEVHGTMGTPSQSLVLYFSCTSVWLYSGQQ